MSDLDSLTAALVDLSAVPSAKSIYCKTCDFTYKNKNSYNVHLGRNSHLTKATCKKRLDDVKNDNNADCAAVSHISVQKRKPLLMEQESDEFYVEEEKTVAKKKAKVIIDNFEDEGNVEHKHEAHRAFSGKSLKELMAEQVQLEMMIGRAYIQLQQQRALHSKNNETN